MINRWWYVLVGVGFIALAVWGYTTEEKGPMRREEKTQVQADDANIPERGISVLSRRDHALTNPFIAPSPGVISPEWQTRAPEPSENMRPVWRGWLGNTDLRLAVLEIGTQTYIAGVGERVGDWRVTELTEENVHMVKGNEKVVLTRTEE